jgi:hypothetical protein
MVVSDECDHHSPYFVAFVEFCLSTLDLPSFIYNKYDLLEKTVGISPTNAIQEVQADLLYVLSLLSALR